MRKKGNPDEDLCTVTCKSFCMSCVWIYTEGQFGCESLYFPFFLPLSLMTKPISYTRTSLAVSALCSLLLGSTPLYAQSKLTSYSDVSAGAWYESAAQDLLRIGALESNEPLLRPNDLATRAEMVKLLVRVNDETLSYPAVGSFTDVSKTAWHFPYFESAARLTWVRGDSNCYGTMPCYARPNSRLNRAEAAAMLVRAFSLTANGTAPAFPDNTNRNQWYYQPIQTAADHCVLQGDDLTGLVRPASNMNRAEMIVMFDRAYKNMKYGQDCASGQAAVDITSATAVSSRSIRIVFSSDVQSSFADDAHRYTVTTLAGAPVAVAVATTAGSRTVDLTLASNLNSNTTYRVSATEVRTSAGITFSASKTFTINEFAPVILNANPLSATRVRLSFNTDIDSSTANDSFRFSVRETGNTSAMVGVQSAMIVDARTIDLNLSSGVRNGVSYNLTANTLLTTSGVTFSDDTTFRFDESAANITTVSSVSSTGLRLVFSTDIERASTETISNYRVISNGRDIPITNARYIDARTVEITVGEALQNQRGYSVVTTGLKTSGGTTFTDSGSTVYSTGNIMFRASLIGAREMPPVLSAMTGSGTFTLSSSGLQYDIVANGAGTFSGSTITMAHFHRGAAGVIGPVVSSINVTGTHFVGTWTNLSQQDRNDLLMGNIYVNVHTQANPNGEIRGQVTAQ